MADNLVVNAGSGGATIAADDVGGVHHQLVKLEYGAADSATMVSPTNPLPMREYPVTTGGLDNYHKVAAASDNAANVKASAGQVYEISVFNLADYPVYVKLHNNAGTPMAGAGVVRTVGVQAGRERSIVFPGGLAFATGIAVTIVKDITDAGTTAVALSDCVVDIGYK